MKEVEIIKSNKEKIIEYLKSSKSKLINRDVAFKITKLTRSSTLLNEMCIEGLLRRVKVGLFTLKLENEIMPKQNDTKQKSSFKREYDKRVKKEQVNHPSHYGGKDNPYEAIKVIEAWDLSFCLGNTIKYISRCGKKDIPIQELKKAMWYLQREISNLEKQNK